MYCGEIIPRRMAKCTSAIKQSTKKEEIESIRPIRLFLPLQILQRIASSTTAKMVVFIPLPIRNSMYFFLILILMATRCHSWNIRPSLQHSHRNIRPLLSRQNGNSALFSQPTGHDHRQHLRKTDITKGISRRNLFFKSVIT